MRVVAAGAATWTVLLTWCTRGTSEQSSGSSSTVTVTESSTPASDSSSAAPATSSASTSTATTSTSSAPAPDAGGELPGDPGEYADAFVRAWGVGDRVEAERYATGDAVDSLFAYDGRGGSTWTRDAVTNQDGRTQVGYTDGTGQSLYVLLDTVTVGAPDAVVSANVEWEGTSEDAAAEDDPGAATGLPSDVGDYGDALVRAWGVGDRDAADAYATASVLSTLFDGYGTGGSDWSRTGSTADSITYTDSFGDTVTIYVDAATVSAGRGDAAYLAVFS